MADNVNFVRSLLQAFNERNFDYIKECTAPNAVLTDTGTGETWRGPDGTLRNNKMWLDAFPDGKITEDRIIASGDLVVVEYTGQGTHTGPLVSSMGTLPATGRSAKLHFCDVYEIKDGKVQTRNSYGDSGSLMVQLGVIAPQAATAE